MSQVRQFYDGQNIFITGVTGFVGRALLEKLLRGCPEIGIIYILIRPKKGKNEQDRIDALLAGTLFDVLRSEQPDFAKKIVGVPGDIVQEGLGLSATDYELVVNKVSVIFHVAATVKFNERLDVATAVNTESVKRIVDLAKACKNLKAGVHVSTAYSHCVRSTIDEELYPPPMSYEDLNEVIKSTVKSNPTEDTWRVVTEKVLGEWPNTYTFTKAIGESIVAEEAKELPFAIFRPSIVISSYQEPMPGWIPSLMGIPGLITGIGLGAIHIYNVNDALKTDLVPLDYVCNSLISCAWETAINEKRYDQDVPVYNYVTASENPITWKGLDGKVRDYGRLFPTNYCFYYPCGFATQSMIVFSILEFVLHKMPALIADRVALLCGKKTRFRKLMEVVSNVMRAISYFSLREWDFKNRRVQNLWTRLTPDDKMIFPFNMKTLDWDEFFMRMIRGLRKFVMSENENDVGKARRRQTYLYIVHTIIRLLMAAFLLWIGRILLRGLNLMINT